ncbi:hypothetical protein Tco_0612495, partial [Tanacetum coccineum]
NDNGNNGDSNRLSGVSRVENANVVYGEHAVNVKVSHNPNIGMVYDHEKAATKQDYPPINFVWRGKKGSIGTQLPVHDPKLNKNPSVGDDGDTSRATYAMINPTIKSTKLVVILGVSITSKEELIGLVEKIESGALDDVIFGLTTADHDVAHALVLDLARGFNYVNSDSDTPSEELDMDTPGVDESPIVQSVSIQDKPRSDKNFPEENSSPPTSSSHHHKNRQ